MACALTREQNFQTDTKVWWEKLGFRDAPKEEVDEIAFWPKSKISRDQTTIHLTHQYISTGIVDLCLLPASTWTRSIQNANFGPDFGEATNRR